MQSVSLNGLVILALLSKGFFWGGYDVVILNNFFYFISWVAAKCPVFMSCQPKRNKRKI